MVQFVTQKLCYEVVNSMLSRSGVEATSLEGNVKPCDDGPGFYSTSNLKLWWSHELCLHH